MIDHIPGCASSIAPHPCDCDGPFWLAPAGFSPLPPATKPPSDVLRSQRAPRNVETLPR